MKQKWIVFMIIIILVMGCAQQEENQSVQDRASENTVVRWEDIVSQGSMSAAGPVNAGEAVGDKIGEDLGAAGTEEGNENGKNSVTADTEPGMPYDWDKEPDPQDTFMLRVEGNISANQAWVDFLKGEIPDYTGVDFTDIIFRGVNRPYTLQDMEGYSLDSMAYGERYYSHDGGQLTDIQIFPYNIDMDEEEELLFVCSSHFSLVKTWVLDEVNENTWCLYPFVSNWRPPGEAGRVWLWSDGYICRRDYDVYEGCPDCVHIYGRGDGYFKLMLNPYRSNDSYAVYDGVCIQEDGTKTRADAVFDRHGTMVDGTLVHAGNVCTGPEYDGDLAILTRCYEEFVGDAVPLREFTRLEGTEDGIIIVTREEFYSGAYLK